MHKEERMMLTLTSEQKLLVICDIEDNLYIKPSHMANELVHTGWHNEEQRHNCES